MHCSTTAQSSKEILPPLPKLAATIISAMHYGAFNNALGYTRQPTIYFDGIY